MAAKERAEQEGINFSRHTGIGAINKKCQPFLKNIGTVSVKILSSIDGSFWVNSGAKSRCLNHRSNCITVLVSENA